MSARETFESKRVSPLRSRLLGRGTELMKSVNIISSLMYPISTHRRKLGRLKRENREDTYIGGRGSARTEASPEAQQIYDELILALLDEFRKIRETLPNLGKKHTKTSRLQRKNTKADQGDLLDPRPKRPSISMRHMQRRENPRNPKTHPILSRESKSMNPRRARLHACTKVYSPE